MSQTATPETDAECFVNEGDFVTGDFARNLELQRDRVKARLSDALAALSLCRDVIGPPEDETWAPGDQVQQAYAAAVALVGPAAPCPTP